MIVKELVNKYLGIPYKNHGRSLEALDCYGLIILIYKDLGYELLDIENYPADWSSKQMNLMLLNYNKQWNKVDKPKLFDCVMLNSKEIVNHGGVMLSSYDFIHCCKHGVVISSIMEPTWHNKIYGYYRFKGIK